MSGLYKITKLPQPSISVFGGSKLQPNSFYTLQAEELSKKLVQHGISVLTGGGPGIMEAIHCGAMKAPCNKTAVLGIGIRGMRNEEEINVCARKNNVIVNYFFARKWLLINYSTGFIVFPGGLGTLDELSDLLNQMITGKRPEAPVICIGKTFWQPYQELLRQSQEAKLIPMGYPLSLTITDDLDEAVHLLINHCQGELFS